MYTLYGLFSTSKDVNLGFMCKIGVFQGKK